MTNQDEWAKGRQIWSQEVPYDGGRKRMELLIHDEWKGKFMFTISNVPENDTEDVVCQVYPVNWGWIYSMNEALKRFYPVSEIDPDLD